MDHTQLTKLAAELSEVCSNYKPTAALEPSPERDAVIHKAREITLALTSPLHFTWTQIGNMYALTSLRTVLHLGILQRIPSSGSISIEALARQSGMQSSLLERLLRVLVVTQFITQNDEGKISHTRLSRSYGAAMGPAMMFQTTYDDCLPGLGRLHHYMAERRSYTEPTDQAYNPFTWSRGQDGRTVWDIMAETRGLEVFQMALATMDKKFPATGFFDFGSLATADEPDRVILVDVGGGIGRTLGAIIKSSPELEKEQTRFILQDLEDPIKQAQKSGFLPAGVRAMAHNMFEAQPVEGAKAYYLRRVLHDYSDDKCVEILKHLIAAAKEDTVILISEMMVPADIGESELPIICMDMSMMNMGGKERSEKQWIKVLHAAGLELKNVWKGFGTDRLLETRLARSQVNGVNGTNGVSPSA
ncbi:catechol O-methyltransferase [Xylariales sp. AK1849]|nr:catechol O-methyltransferase [Xylariales sp. AK1849]